MNIFVVTFDSPKARDLARSWFANKSAMIFDSLEAVGRAIPEFPAVILVGDSATGVVPKLKTVAPKASVIHIHIGQACPRKVPGTVDLHFVKIGKKITSGDVGMLMGLENAWRETKKAGRKGGNVKPVIHVPQ